MRKLTGNKKGINTILAALLMVVIVVVASVMVYAWSTGLLGTLLVQPQTGKEAITLDSPASFANNNSTTLYLRDAGSASITLTTYYVKDNNGNQYTQSAWSPQPTISPNGVNATIIVIGKACAGSCMYNGAAYTATTSGIFSFVPGNSYTVLVVTSRNNQFSFTITR